MLATQGAIRGAATVLKSRPGKRNEPDTMKTFELLSIIGSIAAVGIALAAVVIGSIGDLRTEVHGLRTEMYGLHTELRADIRALDTRLSAVEQRQARTEGLLEGLRDAIAAHDHRNPPPNNDAG